MKQPIPRLVSLCLAVCLLAGAAALPASAAAIQLQPAGSVLDTLLEVPLLGDLLRFFTGAEEQPEPRTPATPESAETAQTGETAQSTAESAATAESATAESGLTPGGTVLLPDHWPEPWMLGSVSAQGSYPAGIPDCDLALTTPVPLWATVSLADGSQLQVSALEQTNFGSLAADAAGYAVASGAVWQQSRLPLVVLINGDRLLQTVPAGTTLTASNLPDYLTDDQLSLVTVTPRRLYLALTAALNSDAMPQIGGLRVSWQQNGDGSRSITGLWLAGLEGARALDGADDSTFLALALPRDQLQTLALDAAHGYADLLAAQPEDQALTLHRALLTLARNCDSTTLQALTSRMDGTGRLVPEPADSWTAVLPVSGEVAAGSATVYLDGNPVTATLDGAGQLTLTGLVPGSHTLQLVPGGSPVYLGSLSAIGRQDGPALSALTLPAGFVTRPLSTPAPTGTPAPSATPVPTVTVTATAAPAPAPAVVPSSAPAATQRPSKVVDPLEGTIIGVTPAPTLEPTPTPTATPKPTLTPQQEQQAEQVRQTSSMLPLYVGLAVVAAGAAVLAVVYLRRRSEQDTARHYHSKKR